MSNNNRVTLMHNTEDVHRSRYAQMQSSILNKSGLSVGGQPKLNLLGKLGALEDTVGQIDRESTSLTDAARESSRQLTHLKRVVAEKELSEYKLKCGEEIKKCERAITYGIADNEKKTEEVWSRCKDLSQSSEELRSTITTLHNRINRLENVLGYYSGAEIVSNY